MDGFRFNVGKLVMCNLGEQGWKLGRVIAMNYREDHWAQDEFAPYQVALEEDYSLIYVPLDDDRYCREALKEDLRIIGRKDALAEDIIELTDKKKAAVFNDQLNCQNGDYIDYHNHRNGRCQCCNDCPKSWTFAELYSEHYRCAARNDLKVTRYEINLGCYRPGDSVDFNPDNFIVDAGGFLQAPTLVRLPPGLTFGDNGSLKGTISYDPHREEQYDVNFVAVSTNKWQDTDIGIIRYEILLNIEQNICPPEFNLETFKKVQQNARKRAKTLVNSLSQTWMSWEHGRLDNTDTCKQMCEDLAQLRQLLELHPRLDNGKWWGNLGGYHMNVHKLLENTLFECELYLGYALTFGDDEVRFYAEQNLQGCYNKRLLEAARFMWTDGIEAMLREEWSYAINIFKLAAEKKSGWGWAVNYGDIWLSEAVATIIMSVQDDGGHGDSEWLGKVGELILKCVERSEKSGVFDSDGHPWANEILIALDNYQQIKSDNNSLDKWLTNFKGRTVYWCSQVLAGIAPFPPRARKRIAPVEDLIKRIPGHIEP